MSQEVLIDVYLVSDIDAWKIIFVTGKRNYAKVFHKQDKLQDVQSKLLEIVEKIEHSLPDPRSPTLRAAVQSEQNEAFKNDDLIELLYKLAGRVETAGIYGNVRVDDVEFAQYCLNRVEPLIRLRSNRSAGG